MGSLARYLLLVWAASTALAVVAFMVLGTSQALWRTVCRPQRSAPVHQPVVAEVQPQAA